MQGFLYDISERYQALQTALDAQTDESAVALIADALTAMDGEIETVCYNGIGYIKNLEAQRDALKAEKERIGKLITEKENYIKRIRAGYAAFLQRTGRARVETDRGNISIASSTATKVDDIAKIPRDYIKTTISEKPDLESIKQAIKGGHPVAGAHLEETTGIRIR